MSASSVIDRALRNIVWLFAHSWGSALFALISFPIMARILGPEPYGIMALADLVFGLTGIIVGAALTECLQQRDVVTREQLDTTFWVNTGLTSVFAVLIIFLAQPIARALGSDAVADVLPALAVLMVIGSLDAVPNALLQRELENQKLVWIDGASNILATALALVLALSGFGVWALVASSALATVISVIGTFHAVKWYPGLRFSFEAFRELYAFNRDTVVTYLLGYLDDAIPRYLLSLVGGERAVGLLSMAGNVAGTLSDLLMGPFDEIAMTVVARLQSKKQMVRDLLDRVFSLTTIAIYPASLGLAVIAPWLIPFLVGDEWVGAVVPLQIFLLLGVRDATGSFNIAILRGVGDSRSPILILSLGVALICGMSPFFMGYGASGIAGLIALRIFLTWPVSAVLVQRATGYSAIRQMTIGWPALLSAFGMFAAVWAISETLPQELDVIARLGILVISGVMIYGALILSIGSGQMRDIREAVNWFRQTRREDGEAIWAEPELGAKT